MVHVSDSAIDMASVNQKSILNTSGRVYREIFDPTNLRHLESYKHYIETGNWLKIQFFMEAPHTTVPATVFAKFALHYINQALQA